MNKLYKSDKVQVMLGTPPFVAIFCIPKALGCMKLKVLVTQSGLTLCDPVDCSPPDSFVHGILQAGILEWVAISFSRDLLDPGIEPKSPALQADS